MKTLFGERDKPMPVPVTIPKATITLEEATILAWRKTTGEPVSEGEILFEMETDKVVVEVPSPATGVLLRVVIQHGPARVNQVVAWVGASGDAIGESAVPAISGDRAPQASAPAPVPSGGPSASPAARRRARELGIDVSGVRGSGPGGRITEQDVERAAQSKG